jgi:hypothetical protein
MRHAVLLPPRDFSFHHGSTTLTTCITNSPHNIILHTRPPAYVPTHFYPRHFNLLIYDVFDTRLWLSMRVQGWWSDRDTHHSFPCSPAIYPGNNGARTARSNRPNHHLETSTFLFFLIMSFAAATSCFYFYLGCILERRTHPPWEPEKFLLCCNVGRGPGRHFHPLQ